MDGETKRLFYHTPKTRELDNLLGDIYHKILGKYCRISSLMYFSRLDFVYCLKLECLVCEKCSEEYGLYQIW